MSENQRERATDKLSVRAGSLVDSRLLARSWDVGLIVGPVDCPGALAVMDYRGLVQT